MADADHRFLNLVAGEQQKFTPISSSSGASDGGKMVKTNTSDGKLDESLIPGNILQAELDFYNPSAVQLMTTTYANVDGAVWTVTPKSSTSKLTFGIFLHISSTGNNPIGHFRLTVGGTEETESKATFYLENGGEIFGSYFHTIDSPGTSSITVRVQGREYDGTFQMELHETRVMDGTASAVIKRPVIFFMETE